MARTLLDNNAIENTSIKLIKLNEDITSILDKIKDLTFTTTIDNSSSDSQFPSAKAVYDQVELLYNSISSTNSVISGIQTVLTQLNTKINTNTSNISDNSTAITTLDNKVNTEVANINTELTTLNDNLSALSTTVTNNYTSLSNLINTNVESLNNTITTNHTEFTEFVNTHNTEYNALVTRVNNLGENVAGIQSNINTIKSDINTITTNLTALTTKVGTIESNLTTLSSDVEYFDISITLGDASDNYNYDATLDKTHTEILSAISNNKKKIRILLNGETFYPTNTIVVPDNSIMFRCLYNSELIMVSSNSDNTAIVSLLSYLNIGNIITSPHNTYEDTQVLSASLANKINYYLVNITSIENLSLVTGYTNYYSGTCTLDKTFNELLEAINNKYNIQIYFSPYTSYCKVSTYVKNNSIIELSFILDRAFFKISYIKSTNKITITQYNISDVTDSISGDNINAISSGAVYNLKTDLESKISSIAGYVKPFIITVARNGSTREYEVVGGIDVNEVQNALNAHNLILLKDDTKVMPLTQAFGTVEEGITLQFFSIYGDGNEHSEYIISVVGYEVTVDYYDYMYATYDQIVSEETKRKAADQTLQSNIDKKIFYIDYSLTIDGVYSSNVKGIDVANAVRNKNIILLRRDDGLVSFPSTVNVEVDYIDIYWNNGPNDEGLWACVEFIWNDLNSLPEITEYENLIWSQKQDKLISGTNIKTINGESILGSGNLVVGVSTIQAGKGVRSEVFNGIEPANASGIYSHVEGVVSSRATGFAAHAEGLSQANGDYSHSEGDTVVANGAASHAEGRGTVATRQSSHAEGDYNVQDDATIHSVGIGTSTTHKDAHRITYDGKHYIIGIGGFDGTKATANLTNEKDLATVINGYETRIAALERALAGIKSN